MRHLAYTALITALALALALAAPAHAGMTLGVQADQVMLSGTDAQRTTMFGQARQLNSGWVRIMLREQLYDGQYWPLVNAMKAAHANGQKVMVSMYRWGGGITPVQWQAFLNKAVPQLAPYVDAWGENEPNHPKFAPAMQTQCVVGHAAKATTVVVKGGVRLLVSYKRVGRGHGDYGRTTKFRRSKRYAEYKRIGKHFRRVKVGATYRRIVRFARERHGGWSRTTRRVEGTPSTITVSTPYDVKTCTEMASAVAYRRIHDITARMVRAYDPTALVIVGELAPSAANEAFMRAVFAAAPGPVDADVIGLHPYTLLAPYTRRDHGGLTLDVIERAVARAHEWHRAGLVTGDRVWATEWGYHWTISQAHPDWIPTALRRMQAAGVSVCVLYDFWHAAGNSWDTGLMSPTGTPRAVFAPAVGWAG